MLDRAPRRPARSMLNITSAIALLVAVAGAGSLPAAASRDAPRAVSLGEIAGDPVERELDLPADADLTAVQPALAPATGDEGGAPADDAGLTPTIQYEDSLAHARDRIAFVPGGRVAIGFTPRDGDAWAVDGEAPSALPAGRLDGTQIRAQGKLIRRHRGEPASDVVPSADAPQGGHAIDAIPVAFVTRAPPGGPGSDARVSPDGLRKEIFGFLPYWELNTTTLRLDYAKISTIAYFGVGADAAGNLQKRNPDGSVTVGWSGWTSSKLTSIIAAAHRAHTRVVLTVQSFGWTTTGLSRQKALLASSTARATLARQIAAAVRDRGADGVNLDFEPLAPGAEAGFTALVRTIRAELNRIHRGYQVTFDTTGKIGNYPVESATASGGADAIFVMGYDYRTAGSSPVGSVAPYSKTSYDIVDTVRAFVARVAPSKVILGVPYYGRAWSTDGGGLNAGNISGPKNGASTTVPYDTAADYLVQHGRRYDAVEGVAWTAYKRQNCTATYGCVTPWRELYVDDATALGAKYDLVNAYHLRGAGMWALGYDGTRPELYAAIKRKFITDTTPPVAGVSILPAAQPNPEFSVSWTGTDDVGVVSYDVQRAVDGGPWTAWLNATTTTTTGFDGDDGHAYAFRVRARDRKGNTSAWNIAATTATAVPLAPGAFATVRNDGLSVRAVADSSGRKIGTLGKGDVVAITGGPRAADGYTWFQISGPLTEWGSVHTTFVRRWVAASSGSTRYLSPAKPPNATAVHAMLGPLGFDGAGTASVGSAPAAVAARSFSPNGDGSRDGLAIAWTNGVALDTLAMKVFRANGTLAGTVPLAARSAGPHAVTWNGRVGSTRLADGRYVVSLVGTAGTARYFNPVFTWRAGALPVYGLTIDTVPPTVSASSISGSLISPNGDGTLDAVRATIAGSGASRWAFGVAPLSNGGVGSPVLVRSGSGRSTGVTWNGNGTDGRPVADGTYRLQLVLLDAAGNHASRTWTVRVDRTPATLAATAPAWFSPDGDGAVDTARLAWSATERISGTVRVYHGTTLIRSWSIAKATGGGVTWNGTTAAGTPVRDGSYTVRVAGRDAAGNLGTTTIPIVVDRTLSGVRWTSAFDPGDRDALAARSKVAFRLARPAVVTGGIYAGSKLVRSIWSKAPIAAGGHAWTWDGRNNAGAFVPPGTYVARISATTALGTTGLAGSVLVDAFDVRLSATTVRAGQTLTVTFRTIEALKALPSVTFSQPGRAGVRKVAVSLGSGRYRVSFVVASGAAGPGTIAIAGRDTGGGVNASTRPLTIQ